MTDEEVENYFKEPKVVFPDAILEILKKSEEDLKAGRVYKNEEVENHFKEVEIILPEFLLKRIKIGQEDIKNGKFYTEEEIDKMDEEWLNEK
jgi:predicted transcriptional regulator